MTAPRSARRRRARAAAACALLFVVLTLAPHAAAQRDRTTTTRPPQDRVRLASQTPWVGRGGEFRLRLLVATDRASGLEVAVTVYQRVATRSDYALTLRDTIRGSPLAVASAPLPELTPDPAGAVTVVVPVQVPGQPKSPDEVSLTREGVYPVRVELRERGGETVADEFTTHLVYVPNPLEGSKLGFAWILPLHAPPALGPDSRRALPVATTARLATITRAIEAHATVPLVLRPTPETLEALATSARPEDRALVDDLAHSLGGRQVLAETYVPVHLPQLLDSALPDELAAQRSRGIGVLAATLGVRPDPRTWTFDEHLDNDALVSLRREQIDRVVVDDVTLDASPLPVTLAQPFVLEGFPAGRRSLDALAADVGIAAHFEPSRDPILAAHQLLADLAVVHFDNPGRPRVVVGAAPRNWVADARFLEVVLGALEASPILAGTTLDAAFNRVPEATSARNRPLVRHLAPIPRGRALPTMPARSIRAMRARLDAFNAVVEPGNSVYEGLDRTLLVAQSVDVRASRRDDYVSGVRRTLDAELARVQMPGNRSVTLTARRGEIPITIRNRLGYPIRVELRVESDKLTFPGGARRRLTLERENTTERFPVDARTSGAFPVRVVLASEDGRLVLGRSLFTVRSTAASGVGVILSVGAGVFLVLWWARHFLRSRRAARALEPA